MESESAAKTAADADAHALLAPMGARASAVLVALRTEETYNDTNRAGRAKLLLSH